MLSAMHSAKRLFLGSVLLCLALPLAAANLPCRPCAGIRIEPAAILPDVARTLKPGGLEAGSPLFVAWEISLSGDAAADANLPATLRDSGATPWLSLVFRTPPPLAQGSERLQAELRAAAEVAAKAPAGTWFQIVWRPETGSFSPTEYAFLLKRAAVTLTGAQEQAKVATEALAADPKVLQALYGEEVAAYLEAVALQPAAAGGAQGGGRGGAEPRSRPAGGARRPAHRRPIPPRCSPTPPATPRSGST